MIAGTIRSVLIPSLLTLGAVAAMTEPVEPQAAAEVAFVEEVTGHVAAFSHDGETQLENFVVISDRTRLELRANSALRICHYGLNRVVTLNGPMQAVVGKDGVSAESGAMGGESVAKCTTPAKSKHQGGLMMRGKPKPRPPE